MATNSFTTHDFPKLAAGEQHFRIPSSHPGLSLFLRHVPARQAEGRKRVALYVHGGTFPSALSIAHRFEGRSWRDELVDAGFHSWGLDFHGFDRFSDPYPEMAEPAETHPPLGRTADASRQLEQAVRFICAQHGVERICLIAHSWGSLAADHFAGRCPDLVERMVLFGPIARRDPRGERKRLPGWRLVSLKDQWDRFVEDVPPGERAVLSRRHFDEWGEAYLDADEQSRTRKPPAVKVPSGAFQDIYDAWAGDFAYDPALVRAPVAIIRGEWDQTSSAADADWLFGALKNSPVRRLVTIGRATHLMHLEESRYALYRETEAFLRGNDVAATPQRVAA
jgi:pimeloyl-ACP methyl ester carboxylesterase